MLCLWPNCTCPLDLSPKFTWLSAFWVLILSSTGMATPHPHLSAALCPPPSHKQGQTPLLPEVVERHMRILNSLTPGPLTPPQPKHQASLFPSPSSGPSHLLQNSDASELPTASWTPNCQDAHLPKGHPKAPSPNHVSRLSRFWVQPPSMLSTQHH